MNDNRVHTRLERAYVRMLAAKSKAWEHRWGDAFVSLVRARNAQRSVAEVRELERQRGLC
jgi:hypothetical protein